MSTFNQAAAGGVCTHPLRWEEGTVTKLLFFFIKCLVCVKILICIVPLIFIMVLAGRQYPYSRDEEMSFRDVP